MFHSPYVANLNASQRSLDDGGSRVAIATPFPGGFPLPQYHHVRKRRRIFIFIPYYGLQAFPSQCSSLFTLYDTKMMNSFGFKQQVFPIFILLLWLRSILCASLPAKANSANFPSLLLPDLNLLNDTFPLLSLPKNPYITPLNPTIVS